MSVDVLHTDPAGQRQRGVRPNPVHHGSQLRQERHQAKTTNHGQILVLVAKYETQYIYSEIYESRAGSGPGFLVTDILICFDIMSSCR